MSARSDGTSLSAARVAMSAARPWDRSSADAITCRWNSTSTSTLAATSTTADTAVATAVRRRRVRTSGILRVEPVAGEAHRLDAAASERLVDPGAQLADVDLHDVGVTLEGEVPDVREDLGLRHDLARPS